MTTVACVKWVVCDQDLKTDPVTRELDTSRARREISAYDRNTIEEAREIAADRGEDVVGLTVGSMTPAGLKDALARGLDSVIHVALAESVPVDGHVTSEILAAAIRSIEGADLVLMTEGASDTYAHETAPRTAELLGWPVVTNVSGLDVGHDVESGADVAHARRILDDAVESVDVKLPAVFSVVPEIAPAPIPGLRAVMGAAKKPTRTITPDELGLDEDALTPRARVISTLGFLAERRHVFHEGTPDEIAASLVRDLEQEGVLP